MRIVTIIGESSHPHLSRRGADMLARLRPLQLTEVEQDEERCLEAMSHWHDPEERVRAFRRRRHRQTLADDNPTGG